MHKVRSGPHRYLKRHKDGMDTPDPTETLRKRDICRSWLRIPEHHHHFKYRDLTFAKLDDHHKEAQVKTTRESNDILFDIDRDQATDPSGWSVEDDLLKRETDLGWDTSLRSGNEWENIVRVENPGGEWANPLTTWAASMDAEHDDWMSRGLSQTDSQSWAPTRERQSAESATECVTPEFLKTPMPKNWKLPHFKKFHRHKTGIARLLEKHSHVFHTTRTPFSAGSAYLDNQGVQERPQSVPWPLIHPMSAEDEGGTVRTRFVPRNAFLLTTQ